MNKEYIVTLDNNKQYALISTIEYENKKYAYLTEMDDSTKYMIGEVVNDEFIEIVEPELLGKLMTHFAKNW
ncbi:MAG TPA: hypothetical protein DCP07_00545 [Lachnospiraceae bacterium]|nr:hypothetical protein [Lachnospiraceae bacterium]